MSTLILRPNGDNTIEQDYGAPNAYGHVNETILDTGDYCSTNSNLYKLNLYDLPNHTTETGTISSVTVTAYCMDEKASYRSYGKLAIKTGGITYYGTENEITNSVAGYSYVWSTNPKTSAAWTWSDIDGLAAGISMCSAYTIFGNRVYNYQLYVTVTYTAPCVVTTQDVSQICTTTATFNGTVTSADATVTRRGFCYKVGTSGDPTTSDSVVYDDGSFGAGVFYENMTGLVGNTSYRVRAYAVDSIGTSYGTTVDMKTLSSGFIIFM